MKALAPASGAARPLRVQLLSQNAGLRTALRRRLSRFGNGIQLIADPLAEGANAPVTGVEADAIVLDTELPGLRGMTLVRQIVSRRPQTAILVVAPDTPTGRSMRSEAMDQGARATFSKPAAEAPFEFRALADELLQAMRAQVHEPSERAGSLPTSGRPAEHSQRTAVRLAAVETAASAASVGSDAAEGGVRERNTPAPWREVSADKFASAGSPRESSFGRTNLRPRHKVLLVASSTGGPQALLKIFAALSPTTVGVPVLVVQHMPAAFTTILAEHLSRATPWSASEARQDEPLTPGEIRVAPGGRHMVIASSRLGPTLRLTEDEPVNFCRPSADVLFTSAAERYGAAVLAIILTGMGNDGCEGAKAIVAAGGEVFAQDRDTSVVWGMPGAAVGAGLAKRVLPLGEMAPAIRRAIGTIR